ncbi:hypothetical protein HK100_000682 [Physocladia obscura]|uniref:Nitrogen regulatory protein areA GATA-like domain-containing protein n=1 Tax=Physocladia obscura TaxID=109957 RepID=A0AAD5SZR2_9FUNG|nr:hypothetical protein HK100_000682 [Physocladia obscura]
MASAVLRASGSSVGEKSVAIAVWATQQPAVSATSTATGYWNSAKPSAYTTLIPSTPFADSAYLRTQAGGREAVSPAIVTPVQVAPHNKKAVYKMLFDNHLHSSLLSTAHHSQAALSAEVRGASVHTNSSNINKSGSNEPSHVASSPASPSPSVPWSNAATQPVAPTFPSNSASVASLSTTATGPALSPLNEVEEDSKRYLTLAKLLAERTKDPLDSQDVWKLCTRAKHAIEGGERLENLSWRLFEMSLSKERKAKRDESM